MISECLEMMRGEFAHYDGSKFQQGLLAGLTVVAVALPLALAFGVAAGADAAAGLVTDILAGILIGGLGGAPFPISGPTGAMSAVTVTPGGLKCCERSFTGSMGAGAICSWPG